MLSKIKGVVPSLMRASQLRGFSTSAGNRDISAANVDRSIVKGQRLQFSKNRLTDFGELPLGEVPDALKYDREFSRCSLVFVY